MDFNEWFDKTFASTENKSSSFMEKHHRLTREKCFSKLDLQNAFRGGREKTISEISYNDWMRGGFEGYSNQQKHTFDEWFEAAYKNQELFSFKDLQIAFDEGRRYIIVYE